MKHCLRCNQDKPLEMFYKHKRTKDGLQTYCKVCVDEQGKAYRTVNKEQCIAARQAYYKANKEQVAIQNRAWKQANPEKKAVHNKAWSKANPNKVAVIMKAYLQRLNLANTKISKRTLAAWSLQAKTAHPYCELCLTTANLEAHHILPKAKYPQFALDLTNAQVLCTDCHDEIHTETLNLTRGVA